VYRELTTEAPHFPTVAPFQQDFTMIKYQAVQKSEAEAAVAASAVVAEATAPFDVEVQDLEGEDNHYTDSLRVRVVAPCGLPPGYGFPVHTRDGQVFDIRVPETGVAAGQAFEGNKIPAKPVTGRFRDDLFGCGGEGCFFCVAFCIPTMAIATIMESMKLNPCGGRSGSGSWRATFYVVMAVWAVFFACYIIIVNTNSASPNISPDSLGMYMLSVGMLYVTLIYLVFVATRTRWAFRQVYHIPGHCFLDCLASYFCNCCSALQMYRHMKASGERPMRWESTTEAEIV
jgi:Cys-rich protein (TIGR01571 family)